MCIDSSKNKFYKYTHRRSSITTRKKKKLEGEKEVEEEENEIYIDCWNIKWNNKTPTTNTTRYC